MILTEIKAFLLKIWDWIDDSPKHVAVAAVVIILGAVFWKALLGMAFWFVVCPGSFALAYAGYNWWKKRPVKV